MKLDDFNQKYRCGKKDNVYKACNEALEIMKTSLDDIHDIKHVDNILEILDKFLTSHKRININYDVLILATCWHDTWKAINKPGGYFNLFYREVVEGLATAKLFKIKTLKYSFSQEIIENVCYAIRKHSTFQVLPHATIEAKLLDDADKVDARNFERIKNSEVEKRILTKKTHLKFVLLYLKYMDQKINHTEYLSIYNSQKEGFVAYLKAKI